MSFYETQLTPLLQDKEGVMGRYSALTGIEETSLKNTRLFFDLYLREGLCLDTGYSNKSSLDALLTETSHRAFPKAVEYRPFQDADLINVIQKLSAIDLNDVEVGYSSMGDNFIFANLVGSEKGTEAVRIAHDRYANFVRLLNELTKLIDQYKEILKECDYFENLQITVANTKLLSTILENIVTTPDSSGAVNHQGKGITDLGVMVEIQFHAAVSLGLKLKSLKSHCHLPGNAAAEFFQINNLQPFVQEGLLIAQLLEYARMLNRADSGHFGVYPVVLPTDERGLRFSLNNFHHPYLLRNGQGNAGKVSIPVSFYQDSEIGNTLVEHMTQAGIWSAVSNTADRFSQRTETSFRWCEGVTVDEVIEALDAFTTTSGADSVLRGEILEHYRTGASEHFGSFSLGEVDPQSGEQITVVVLPSPNMAGKSTSLKAIGLLLHSALMGRKVTAEIAEMTIPDQIYHNFNVEDDVTEQRSTFKAQLENIRDFLDNATIHSLGLFDELFNGTSSDYQLALAWAFLEKCTAKSLRVIVTTHNRDLEFYSDPEGYQHIAGSYSRPKDRIQPIGARGAKTLSIGSDRQFKYGSERDSEALVIAREVLYPQHNDLLNRAEAILYHIRSC